MIAIAARVRRQRACRNATRDHFAEKLGASLLIFATLAVGLYPKLLLDRIMPAVEAMRFLQPMSYLELLQLACAGSDRCRDGAGRAHDRALGGRQEAGDTLAGTSVLGVASRRSALARSRPPRFCRLPAHATLFHGMLVISPLNSLFQVICLVLAFFTIILARGEHSFA